MEFHAVFTQRLLHYFFYLQVNGHWTDWTMWSGCSVTCGSGHKTRQRYCSNPPPSHGGSVCAGSSTGQTSCSMVHCPGKKYPLLDIYIGYIRHKTYLKSFNFGIRSVRLPCWLYYTLFYLCGWRVRR